MKNLKVLAVSMCLSFPVVSLSQQPAIPFAQLAYQTHADTLVSSYGESSSLSSTSSFALSNVQPPIASARKPRIATVPYWTVNLLHFGTAGADLALTQHCINTHTCREGNPIMPGGLGTRAGMTFGLTGLGAFASYRLKKQNSPVWAISPIVGTAAHIFGLATGIQHY